MILLLLGCAGAVLAVWLGVGTVIFFLSRLLGDPCYPATLWFDFTRAYTWPGLVWCIYWNWDAVDWWLPVRDRR